MKRFLKKAAFPCLLTCACVTVWFWQHAAASLPYLPLNGVVPLGIMTPALPVLAFFTAFVMLKQSNTPRPVFRALLAALAMLAVILGLGVYFLSYLSYRFAAVLPVPVLPATIPLSSISFSPMANSRKPMSGSLPMVMKS